MPSESGENETKSPSSTSQPAKPSKPAVPGKRVVILDAEATDAEIDAALEQLNAD